MKGSGPVQIGVLPAPLGCTFAELQSSWRAGEEAGFHSLWAFDHATPTPDRSPAWEASSVLVAMASCTRTIPIGILVFDVLLRHPFILAGSVAVAQTVSGGRVRVGLGVGDRFSRLDHQTLGIPFPPFAERIHVLEACCRVLPALWQGQEVTEPLLGLKNATLGRVHITPPAVILGGANRAIIETAVRHAQGWNLFTHDPRIYASRSAVVADVEAARGGGKRLSRSVYMIIDRLPGDISLRKLLGEFEAAGAEEAMLVLLDAGDAPVRRLADRAL